MIIDDKAAWDFRDASPQKKVIITKDGWFAVEMDGNIGYVRQEYVYWDVIDTN